MSLVFLLYVYLTIWSSYFLIYIYKINITEIINTLLTKLTYFLSLIQLLFYYLR